MQTDQQTQQTMESKEQKIFTREFISIMIADLAIRACTSMLSAMVPLYVLEQGYPATIAGLTLTLYMLTAVFFRPISGRLVDTKGRYIIMLIGSLVYSVATGFYLFSIPIWIFLGIRVLQGFGFAFNGTALTTMATDIIPENRMSEGIGYLGLTQTIAQAFGPAIAVGIKNAYGYHVTFIVIFGFAVLNVVSRLNLKAYDRVSSSTNKQITEKSNVAVRSEKKKESFFYKIVDKYAWKPSLIMMFIMVANSGVNTFLIAYASQSGITNPGVYFTASAIMVAVARLSVGKIQDRFGSIGIIAPGLGLIFLAMVGIYKFISLPILILAGACYGFGIGVIRPVINSLAVLAADRENRGMANSTLFLAMDLGNAIGAVILGSVAEFTGLVSVFGIGATIIMFNLVLYLILRRNDFFGESKLVADF